MNLAFACAIAGCMLLLPVGAQASYSLLSNNSAISFNAASVLGLDGWFVDGVSQLAQQSWYYRIGETAELPLVSLGTPTVRQLAANAVEATYSGLYVDVVLRYTLTGGPEGSGNSTVAEMMRIRNKTAAPMAFHLFEYTDLDLNGTPGDDSAAQLNATTIGQWDGAIISTETASVGGMTPTPNHWEVGVAPSTLNKLNDSEPTTLADAVSSLDRTNAAFAFQWDMNLAAGASQILSKSKTLLRGGAIGDTVWFDANSDGMQDADEPGIEGVTVILSADFNNDGAVDYTTSMATDGDGFYMFANLPAGHYAVTVDESTLPAGATQTYDLDGLDTPNRASVDLATGQVNTDVDFGYVLPVGSYTTFTQGGWGSKPHGNNPGALLAANFGTVFPAGVTIGVGNQLTFTSAKAIEDFLPQGGKPAVLKASATNPTSSAAGVLAGQVLALKLSVSFSNTGITSRGLGWVKLDNGMTVSQVLALAEKVLGGDTCALPRGMSVSDLNSIVDGINNMYDRG